MDCRLDFNNTANCVKMQNKDNGYKKGSLYYEIPRNAPKTAQNKEMNDMWYYELLFGGQMIVKLCTKCEHE